jgi:outer membrane protein TolC
LERNPEIRAGFERWQASVQRISRARRLPEPTIGFGYFVQSVETRVGPQQARISLQQAFPWPTRLTAGADAASTQARAMQRRFEAQSLTVAQRVATAYWNLWQVRTTRAIYREHLEVIRSLSESVRARMSTGAAMLADLQQIDLAAARIENSIRGMDEAERAAEAQLRAAVGVTSEFSLTTPQGPGRANLPVESSEELASLVRAHPMVESLGLLAEASDATARAEGAERYPSFTVSADWIITGEAAMPDVEGSGRDAVIVGAGIRVPLWQGSYGDSVAAAEADSRAQRAEQRALLDRKEAELATTLANLRDAARRVDLYRMTLVPQAETAYESVLGAYTVGRGTVAQALLAQRDLLELRVELERTRADHARAWARLEDLVGRELAREPEPIHGESDEQ